MGVVAVSERHSKKRDICSTFLLLRCLYGMNHALKRLMDCLDVWIAEFCLPNQLADSPFFCFIVYFGCIPTMKKKRQYPWHALAYRKPNLPTARQPT